MRTGVVAAALAALVGLPALAAGPDGGAPLEHQVKIAFLYNFAKFVEWPASTLPEPASPLTIGILGGGALCDDLARALEGKSVGSRPIAVRRFRDADQVQPVQILFVGPALAGDLSRILATLRNAPVLTVGDADGFAARGGVINFRLEENRVRFEVNVAAAERAGLRISSRLLSLARVVPEVSVQRGR